MGVLLTIHTISFILCVSCTLFLIYTIEDEDSLECYKSVGFSIDELKNSVLILSVGSVIPVLNTLIAVLCLYSFVKGLVDG